jgi:hypothetical protein
MRPGLPLLALHGKQKQNKRTAIYNDFSKKQHAVRAGIACHKALLKSLRCL